MPEARIGKGAGDRLTETINVFGIETSECCAGCSLKRTGGRFCCERYNGNAVVKVSGGIRRDTLEEFKDLAPCFNQ